RPAAPLGVSRSTARAGPAYLWCSLASVRSSPPARERVPGEYGEASLKLALITVPSARKSTSTAPSSPSHPPPLSTHPPPPPTPPPPQPPHAMATPPAPAATATAAREAEKVRLRRAGAGAALAGPTRAQVFQAVVHEAERQEQEVLHEHGGPPTSTGWLPLILA